MLAMQTSKCECPSFLVSGRVFETDEAALGLLTESRIFFGVASLLTLGLLTGQWSPSIEKFYKLGHFVGVVQIIHRLMWADQTKIQAPTVFHCLVVTYCSLKICLEGNKCAR